jgi:hypothetical protein
MRLPYSVNQNPKRYVESNLPDEVVEVLTPEEKNLLIDTVTYLVYQAEIKQIERILDKNKSYKRDIEYRYKSTLKPVNPNSQADTLETESLEQVMERINKMADLSIEDIYYAQDASDMFFNHEIVVKAYQSALETRDEDLRDGFIRELKEANFFNDDHVPVIIDNFLKRL